MSKLPYRGDIDGLRAVAVTSVVLFHAWPSLAPGGFTGVDIFFVISGYLIGGIIFQEIGRKEFSFANFYARRARRILPALLTLISAALLFGWFVLNAGELTELAASANTAILGVSNIKFFLRNDYFAGDSSLLPMLMTWTLGVEEQFYLILPFLLIAASRFSAKAIWLIIAAFSLASFSACVVLTKTHPTFAFFLLPPRFWELGVGTLLAIRHRLAGPSVRMNHLCSIAGIALLVLTVYLFDDHTPFPGIAALLPVTGALLLIHSADGFINRKLLSTRPMVFAGLVSYSWYLWHWPLMAFARLISIGAPSFGIMMGIVALSFVLACLSWKWVEQPFRKNLSPVHVTLMRYGVVMAVSVALTLGLKTSHGWPSRLSHGEIRTEDTMAQGRGNCLTPFGNSRLDTTPACLPAEGPKDALAVLGDSHASALGPGLADMAAQLNLRLLQFTKSSCRPLLHAGPIDESRPEYARECAAFMSAATQRITEDPSVKTVIVAADWTDAAKSRYLVTDGREKGTSVNAKQAMDTGLPALLDRLTWAGKKVLVAGDVPGFKFDPTRQVIAEFMPFRYWLARLISPNGLMPDGAAGPEYLRDIEQSEDWVEKAASSRRNVSFFSLKSQLCPEGSCSFEKNGTLLFIDAHHLSVIGSRSIRWPLTRP